METPSKQPPKKETEKMGALKATDPEFTPTKETKKQSIAPKSNISETVDATQEEIARAFALLVVLSRVDRLLCTMRSKVRSVQGGEQALNTLMENARSLPIEQQAFRGFFERRVKRLLSGPIDEGYLVYPPEELSVMQFNRAQIISELSWAVTEMRAAEERNQPITWERLVQEVPDWLGQFYAQGQ